MGARRVLSTLCNNTKNTRNLFTRPTQSLQEEREETSEFYADYRKGSTQMKGKRVAKRDKK